MDANKLLNKVRRLAQEPKVYSILVKTTAAQVLHIGVHYSLEEAYVAARERLLKIAPVPPGETAEVDLWNYMTARDAILMLCDNSAVPKQKSLIPLEGAPKETHVGQTSVPEFVQHIKKSKNDLMQKIIESGDAKLLDGVKNILSKKEVSYIQNKLALKQ